MADELAQSGVSIGSAGGSTIIATSSTTAMANSPLNQAKHEHTTTTRQISEHNQVTRLSSTESSSNLGRVVMSFSVQIGFVREAISIHEGNEFTLATLKDIVCHVVKKRVSVILF